MATVDLSDNEWGQVMASRGDASWKLANPLLMKIGGQLQAQFQAKQPQAQRPPHNSVDGNSQEVRHE